MILLVLADRTIDAAVTPVRLPLLETSTATVVKPMNSWSFHRDQRRRTGFSLKNQDARAMKVHEYQAKELLKKAGVAVPEGIVVTTPDGGRQGLRRARRRLDRRQGPGPRRRPRQGSGRSAPTTIARWRSRSPAGASRGPTRWPRACSSSSRPRKREKAAASLLGKTLVTYQTGAAGAARSPRCWSPSGTTSPASSTWAWRSTAACSARS